MSLQVHLLVFEIWYEGADQCENCKSYKIHIYKFLEKAIRVKDRYLQRIRDAHRDECLGSIDDSVCDGTCRFKNPVNLQSIQLPVDDQENLQSVTRINIRIETGELVDFVVPTIFTSETLEMGGEDYDRTINLSQDKLVQFLQEMVVDDAMGQSTWLTD